MHPHFCPLSFDCTIVSGPRLDLCAVSELDFNVDTGEFIFSSNDYENFPPGLYVMQIEVNSGLLQKAFIIELDFVKPEIDIEDSTDLVYRKRPEWLDYLQD